DADAKSSEQAGADVNRDRAELLWLHPRLAQHEVDRRHERLGMAAPARRVEPGQHAFVAADGAAHLGGGALDAEDQHGVTPRPIARAPGAALAAGAPTARRAATA